MNSKEYNLAGKQLVVDGITILGTRTKPKASRLVETYNRASTYKETQKEIEDITIDTKRYELRSTQSAIIRDDESPDFQIINLIANIVGYEDPKPNVTILASSTLQRICAYNNILEPPQGEPDIGDTITPTPEGEGSWHRGGLLFNVGDEVTYIEQLGAQFTTYVLQVTAVGENSVTGTVTDILHTAQGLDDRDMTSISIYMPYRLAGKIDAYLYDGLTLKSRLSIPVSNITREWKELDAVDYYSDLTFSAPDGSFFVDGDCCVVRYTWDQDAGAYSFTETTYVLKNGVWEPASSTGDAGQLMRTVHTVVEEARKYKEGVDPDYSFEELYVGSRAVFDDMSVGIVRAAKIFANDITSSNYTEDANGNPILGYNLAYRGGPNEAGQVKAVDGVYNRMKVIGAIDMTNDETTEGADILHPCLTTVPQADVDKPVETISAATATHWKGSDATFNNISANAMTAVSSSFYGGTTISRVCRCTAPSTRVYADGYTFIRSNIYGRYGSTNWTVPENGSYEIKIVSITTWGGTVFGQDGYGYVNINGSRVYSLPSVYMGESIGLVSIGKYTLKKGDIITFGNSVATAGSIDTDRTEFGVYSDHVTLSDSGITSSGLWWSNSSNVWEKVEKSGNADIRPSGTRLYVANNWDSNSHLRFRSLGYLATSYMSGLNDGNAYTVTGSLTLNGSISIDPVFIQKSGGEGVLICIDTNGQKKELALTTSDFYDVTGTLQIKASARGVKTMALYPDGDFLYDIGDGDTRHYRNIYCQAVRQESKRELKTNIEPFTDSGLDIINSVDVMKYNFKSDIASGIPPEKLIDYIGFIADDTDARLSGKQHDSFVEINCIGVLIKAMQEMSAKLDALTNPGN